MSATSLGRVDWKLRRDDDGHRDYLLTMLVETTSALDGPATVFFASGLPAIGASWVFGNDNDPWAFCTPGGDVRPIVTGEPNFYWLVDLPFTTRPLRRCQTTSIDNPLSEPQAISGSFINYQRKAETNALGNLILSSSHEKIDGLMKDAHRPSVVIEQNVSGLGLPTFTAMVNTLNDATLWGLPTRCIKLSNVSWARRLYGTCTFYYTRRFEFDIRFDTFDIYDVADTGFKVFDDTIPDTPSNRADPRNFKLYDDPRGHLTPTKILLDGNGDALDDPTAPIFLSPIPLYTVSNFLTLGIPTSL